MTTPTLEDEPLTVPAAAFGSTAFWRRLNHLAVAAGHDEHPLMLVGHVDPNNRYTLQCQRCTLGVVEMVVRRD
ncbi:hypothetical protein JNW90_01030 [Micromonospora sp. STR1s_5]|nr:hypothetical protein [Micromonospora sp. STR1s_5]